MQKELKPITVEFEYQEQCPMCDLVRGVVPLVKIMLRDILHKFEFVELETNNKEAPIFKYYYDNKLIGMSKGIPFPEDKDLIIVYAIHNIMMGIWNTMVGIEQKDAKVKQVLESLEHEMRYGQTEQWVYTINTLTDVEQIKGMLSIFPCKARQKILTSRLKQLESEGK